MGSNEASQSRLQDGGKNLASASPIAVGEVIRSYLDERETEYFRFNPRNDATYVIYSLGPTDTNARLYNERFSDMGGDYNNGEDGNFRIAARLKAGFTYYIQVQGRPGPYTLHIDGPEGATKSDDHGFSNWAATPIKAGNIKEGRIDTSNDQDYFRLVPRENDTYVIFTRGQTSTQGTLYDEAFNTIAHNMYSPKGEDRNFRIAHRLEAGRTYYILVRGKPGLYRLHVEGTEGATRSDDHGFSNWSATTIRPGSATEGVLDVTSDQDYFRLTPEKDGTYVIYTRGSTANPNGTLYDEAFNQLKNHHAANKGGGYFRIEHYLNAGRTYFVLVRGGKGSYTLNVDGPESVKSDQSGRDNEAKANFALPFQNGASWIICHGYNGFGAHAHGHNALDITQEGSGAADPGRNGCTGDSQASSRKTIVVPTAGRVEAHLRANPDMLCFRPDIDNDGKIGPNDNVYMKIGHIDQGSMIEAGPTILSKGTTIGVTSPPNVMNGNYSHIHIELTNGCGKDARSLDFSGTSRFDGAPNMPANGSVNQWRGTVLTHPY